jgi:hypothetical protein
LGTAEIQIEVSLVYLITFWNKSLGPAWIDGTALHYVQHLDQFKRFPIPAFFYDPVMVAIGTRFTLAVEFALGVPVWLKELRYKVLSAGVMLHPLLEYAMNVPVFQWIMLSSFVTFVYLADVVRAIDWLDARVLWGVAVRRRSAVRRGPRRECRDNGLWRATGPPQA